MTREDFILQRLKDDRAQYRVLFVVCVAAVIGSAILCAVMLASRAFGQAAAVLGMGATLGGYAAVNRSAHRSVAAAIQEIEEDPEGLAFPEDYSVATATVIEKALQSAKTYRQLFIAYGICGVMMVVLGLFLVAIMLDPDSMGLGGESYIFAALGALLATGGVLLCVLSFQAARNARVTEALEAGGVPDKDLEA